MTIHSIPWAAGAETPAVRRITTADLDWALAQGWKDFIAKRGDVVLIALIYPFIGFAAAAASLNERALLPMFFPLVAGLSILGPALASGFYEIARRRDAGLDASWRHFFDPLGRRGRWSLRTLTLALGVLFALWLAAAWAVYATTLGRAPITGLADFVSRLFTTPEGWTMIIVGNLMGAAFAAVTLVFSLVSFPMAVDKAADPFTAVETSVRAVQANLGATIAWGARIAVLLLVGCLPAFVGLAVVLPVLGYATWHLYTRLVER
ncbi:MAG TPA: DUF2189 domain-containing protein [Caulobacteraceae bacterium]|nr:DUF2189 domain-containing protein [Caulobacteraceae bacterium]